MGTKPKFTTSLSKDHISWFLKLIFGPVAFLILLLSPIPSVTLQVKILAATYLWVIVWWIMRPIPWAISSMLPLVIIPLSGIAKLSTVTTAYGQKIMFFLIGVLLVGHAVQKHGLGKRIALSFLSIPFVGSSINRILFVFMLTTAIVSAFVDDAASVAMMMPIGMSIVKYAMDPENKGKSVGKLGVFMALGVLYSSEAGGVATFMGLPHNPLSVSLLENLCNVTINFVQFSQVGIIIAIVTIVAYFLILRLFLKPELNEIPGAREYFKEELKKLGPFSPGERNTMIVMVTMIILWILPSFATIPVLDVWIPPFIGVVLLYILPISLENKESTITANDFQHSVPWNIIFLSASGAAMADLLIKFELLQWIQATMSGVMNKTSIVLFSGFATGILTNFVSGLAAVNLMDSLCLPFCSALGIEPAIIARIIPNVGVGYVLPWAGAASALAFAAGNIKINEMIKVGLVALFVHVIIVISLNLILVPLFHAYSPL
ncbi:sodium-dependent transporter [Desulfocucumis palustris]|uniref:Sodium-dependent dicarboxylate transporter SdcS n=1 Tax=Desulfocucumis palustris TaxID=1898651 RepID=A0A2L2X931_9FIRM|nr:SLC13 family permease [Desulfocucumis palustris]GBF32522.1 sodium-dependent transporter [Desulfocucumis palustris]